MVFSALLPILLIAASPTHAGNEPAAVPPPEQQAASPGGDDRLELVRKLLRGLRTDQDHESRYAFQVFETLLETGRLEEAEAVARTIPDYRRQVALFRISSEWRQLGRAEAADRAFADGEARGAGVLDFERDEIRCAKAIALADRGETEAARAVAREILSRPVRMDAAVRIVSVDSDEAADQLVDRLAEIDGATPANRARALLRAAAAQFARGENARTIRFTRAAAEELAKGYGVETVPLLREAVEWFARAGEMDEAARWADVALGFAVRVDPRADWKARELRLAAEAMFWAGRPKEAGKVLADLPNAPGTLDPIGYSRGGMQAALGFAMQGRYDLFDRAALHVIEHGGKHPHHRARAMAGVDVVCAYLQAGRPVPEPVRVALDKLIEGIESDPQWIRPV